MTILHIIKPDLSVDSREYDGDLEYKCVPFSVLRDIIGCHDIEHVSVLWKGKRAHMFVDENGHARGEPFNWKASAIYSNATPARMSKDHSKLYNDLSEKPKNTAASHIAANMVIVGTACLWEGEME